MMLIPIYSLFINTLYYLIFIKIKFNIFLLNKKLISKIVIKKPFSKNLKNINEINKNLFHNKYYEIILKE